MEQKFDLKTLPHLNPMHDQRIESIELREKKLIFHYNNLWSFDGKNDYRSCDVIFSGVKDADVHVAIIKRDGLIFSGIEYVDNEFLEYIAEKQYTIETIYFHHSYCTVIIEAALLHKNGGYSDEDCFIKITANEVEYQWK